MMTPEHHTEKVNSIFASPMKFLFTLISLGGLFFVIWLYRLETSNGLDRLLLFFGAGFIVHQLLPEKYRDACFVFMAWAGIIYALKPFAGAVFILCILGFIFIADQKWKYRTRLILVLAGACLMIVIRMQVIYMPRMILATTFAGIFMMFRMVVYMYEVKHEKSKAPLLTRLSYFFLLPNLCFPMFPIVDYKTFLACKNRVPAEETWRKGCRLIMRGVTHLLIYRLVYMNVVPSPASLSGPLQTLFFIVTSYVLILRMSGIYYIGIGIIMMFGYDLPPIMNNFLLIPSTGEIWRRINIYWKDFVTKIFFYPIWFRLRKIKGINAFFLTGIITFFITWQLHSWQWFWILGTFPWKNSDLIYWMTLGSIITFGLWRESIRSKNSSVPPGSGGLISSFKLVLGIISMYFLMSFLWSVWNSSSIASWKYMMGHFTEGKSTDWLILAGILLAIFSIGILIHRIILRYRVDIDRPMSFVPTMIIVVFFSGLLIGIANEKVRTHLPGNISSILSGMTSPSLNQYDRENSEQGYYEQLLEDPNNRSPWEIHTRMHKRNDELDDMIIMTNDLLQRRLIPSRSVVLAGKIFSTNKFGLRDKEYNLHKPKGTYRIILMGGSYEMGSGVGDGENYESLVEQMLNEHLLSNDSIKQIEILNFGGGGYHLTQQVWLSDHEIMKYDPDLVIYMAHTEDPRRLNGFAASLIQNGVTLEYPFLNDVKKKAGVVQSMSRDEIRNRLNPFMNDIFLWGYNRIAENCKKQNIPAAWILLPATADHRDATEESLQQRMATEAGFHAYVLGNIYAGKNIAVLQVGHGDTHPNAAGHQLIANALYKLLTEKTLRAITTLNWK